MPRARTNSQIADATIDSNRGRASFKFKAGGDSTSYECKFGRHLTAAFEPCHSPAEYRHLKPGEYTFAVRAVGPGGADLTPATKRFTISG